jgi:hypothetical protein
VKTVKKTTTEKPRLYILMRNDLPSMTTGRAMAQASHAANAFIGSYGHRKDVKAWQKETKQNFGTAIVLAASLNEMKLALVGLSEPNDFVIDPEYGVKTNIEMLNLIDPSRILGKMTIINEDGSAVIFKSEVTCAYVFGTKEALDPILGQFRLHP